MFGHHDDDDTSNSTHVCTAPSLSETSTAPFVGNFSFYQLNMIISGAFTALTCILMFVLMGLHITHLSKPNEQYRILRICFLIPAYGFISFLSVCSPQASTYLTPWQAFFEAIAMGSFFLLMGEFINPNENARLQFYSALQVPGRRKSSTPVNGLKWYNSKLITVFQYPIVAFGAAVATDLTEAAGVYCEGSSKLYFASLWIRIASYVSLIICILSIIRYYKVLKVELRGHRVLLKLVAFKAVIGISLLEKIIFWILTSTNTLTTNAQLSYADVTIGIPSMIVCIQVIVFACLFHYAYSASPYYVGKRESDEINLSADVDGHGYKYLDFAPAYQGNGLLNFRAWLAAVDPREAVTVLISAFSNRSRARASMVQESSYEAQLENYRRPDTM